MLFALLTYSYAFILLGGGIFAFVAKGSIESLVVSFASFAVTVILERLGLQLFHVATGLGMTWFMGIRFLDSMKFMPAGMVASLSLAFVILTIVRVLRRCTSSPEKKKQK